MEAIKKRDESIDLMKFLLVTVMILAHVIQFFVRYNELAREISYYANLITFSGFLFCFGYVSNSAYFKKDFNSAYKKILKNVLRLYLAFLISGLAFQIFVARDPLSLNLILNIMTFRIMPGWSEFLAGFAALNLFILILFEPIKWLTRKKIPLTLAILTTLGFTFVPLYNVNINFVGLFIGSREFASFPVIQYLMYFLLGMYFQEKNVTSSPKWLFLASISSLVAFPWLLIGGGFPTRFPPSIAWVLAPALILYGYYLFCKKIMLTKSLNPFIKIVGENPLIFLVSSNVLIFFFTFVVHLHHDFYFQQNFVRLDYRRLNLITSLFITAVIMGLTGSFIQLINQIKDKKIERVSGKK